MIIFLYTAGSAKNTVFLKVSDLKDIFAKDISLERTWNDISQKIFIDEKDPFLGPSGQTNFKEKTRTPNRLCDSPQIQVKKPSFRQLKISLLVSITRHKSTSGARTFRKEIFYLYNQQYIRVLPCVCVTVCKIGPSQPV